MKSQLGRCWKDSWSRELFRQASNWRSRGGLDEYLRDAKVPGLAQVDTRALVRRIRGEGRPGWSA